jgi:hypothetical protein
MSKAKNNNNNNNNENSKKHNENKTDVELDDIAYAQVNESLNDFHDRYINNILEIFMFFYYSNLKEKQK